MVIVMGFAGDKSHEALPYDSDYDWGNAIFGQSDSLAAYYRDMSSGTFTYAPAAETCAYDSGDQSITNKADRISDGVVHVTLDHPHGAWGLVNDKSDVAQEFGKVVLEAFQKASDYVDFAAYDSNGDALLTPDELVVAVCVAGLDASPFSDPSRNDLPLTWPHSGILNNKGYDDERADGMLLDSYIAIAEHFRYEDESDADMRHEPIGILYHELGHSLGLPDLYPLNVDSEKGAWGKYRVDRLSLMDSGGWAETSSANGAEEFLPTAFDAWSRYVLNWELPEIVTTSGTYTVSSQLSDSGYRSLLIPSDDPDQYYLIENRQPEGIDAALSHEYAEGNPRGGIVIWHVDKAPYRTFGEANEMNNTDHAPGVMQLLFETAGSDNRYTTDWQRSAPVLEQPFFDSASCQQNLGDANASITLPLYASDFTVATPETRRHSNVTVQFPTESARDMAITVSFDSEFAASSSQVYVKGEERIDESSEGSVGETNLGRIASAALLRETGAQVAIVDEGSIQNGIPKGDVTYSAAESVLPSDSTIIGYQLSGSDLKELILQSYARSVACRVAHSFGSSLETVRGEILNFSGISFVIRGDGDSAAYVASAEINGTPVNDDQSYYVVSTRTAIQQYPVFAMRNPYTLLLHGSPADAVRSFLQDGDWELEAQAKGGSHRYLQTIRTR